MIHDNHIYTTTLPCGMRLICAPSVTDVAYCGIAVDAGTRDELENESGMAHFLEHLSFKGTQRRRAWHILNRMEAVGGDLNAYTGKEETVYYTCFMKEHLARAVDLLADIVLASTYPQAELEKEAEVVCDEIESYNDSPSELIFDDFEALVFRDHALGRNILGQADALRSYDRSQPERFAQRLYRPQNMVCFVHGNIAPERAETIVEKAVERALQSRGAEGDFTPQRRVAPHDYVPQSLTLHKDTHQAHVMMGCRAWGAMHENRPVLYLLNNVLGGPGMNSRFNLALRERSGLVYAVESNMTCYTDTGLWSVYFGCDPHDVKRCMRLVHSELKRIISDGLSESALLAAKKQIKGQMGIAADNFENRALALAKNYLHYNRVRTKQEVWDEIDSITPQQIKQVAQQLFLPENLTTLIYE